MSATLQRPAPPRATRPPPPAASAPEAAAPAPAARTGWGLEIAVAALLAGAALSLGRVYVGLGFLRPVLAALLLSLALTAGIRRLGGGPVLGLLGSAAAWLVFVGVAFVPATVVALVVPTPDTVTALVDLWSRGFQLLRLRPAPAFPEPGLMLITVTGVWWVAHAVEGLVFRLAAPVRAVLMAMLLWTVPLAVAPQGAGGWPWAVPFLAAAAALLLAFAGADLGRWGTWVDPWTGRRLRPRGGLSGNPLAPAGALIAVVAIVAGILGGGRLPGSDDPPWWQLRGRGGTTLTTNPIVNLRASLVAQGDEPLLRVRTPRPVYLRTTALDVYSETEEWTSSGIRGSAVPPLVPFEVPIGPSSRFWLDIEVVDLPDAVLVPVPYQPEAIAGPAAERFRYDRSSATFTLERGSTLQPGDEYAVFAAIPSPTAEQLDAATVFDPTGQLTALPDNVPQEVLALARDIVAGAGATTPFQQALAIQEELRSWEYSLDPPQGHSGEAMRSFVSNRIGYCEQYAGTMAVMLRSLGIPARVAVGFSPGRVVDPDAGEYLVTSANAHAWVEVLFPGLGWIAFEPTPRSDGNVLVPSAENLAPSQTVASSAAPSATSPQQGDFPTGSANPGMDSVQAAGSRSAQERSGGRSGGSALPTPLLVAAAAVGVLVVALARRRQRRRVVADPATRVSAALAAVTRIGRGLGQAPSAWETTREYLTRLAPGDPAATALAEAVERVRYAPDPPDDVAPAAEDAGAALRRGLLAGRSALQRRWVRGLGAVRDLLAAAPASAARRPLRRRWRRPASAA